MVAPTGMVFHTDVNVLVELPVTGLVANHSVFLSMGWVLVDTTFGVMTGLVIIGCG